MFAHNPNRLHMRVFYLSDLEESFADKLFPEMANDLWNALNDLEKPLNGLGMPLNGL